jgi:hypothetical protein
VKLSKKTIPQLIASTAAAHGTLFTSRSKTALGASDLHTAGGHPCSKTIGGTSGSKTAAPIKKRRVPPAGPMVGASLEESQDTSLRGPMTQTVVDEILLRLEPHGQSPPASVFGPNPPAVLQTTTPFGAGGGSTVFLRTLQLPLFVLLNDVLTFAAAYFRCSRCWCWRSG